jgi:hypothetical protein
MEGLTGFCTKEPDFLEWKRELSEIWKSEEEGSGVFEKKASEYNSDKFGAEEITSQFS